MKTVNTNENFKLCRPRLRGSVEGRVMSGRTYLFVVSDFENVNMCRPRPRDPVMCHAAWSCTFLFYGTLCRPRFRQCFQTYIVVKLC